MSATPPPRSPWNGTADADEMARWSLVAEEVAAILAADAVARDRAGDEPTAEVQLLRDSGLVNLMIPTAFGGEGAHWETAFMVTRILGRADASIAQILGYHYLNSGCISFYGDDTDASTASQETWYRESAKNRWVWSDAFNPVSPDLTFIADGEDYLLSGTKHFATGASSADRVITAAVASGGALDGERVIFALDGQSDGIRYLDNWDHLGQRASASGSAQFDGVRVTGTDIVGVDKEEPFSTVVTPGVQLLFGNIYLAIAEGALAQAKEITLARKNSWFLSGVDTYAEDPVTHQVYGELVARTRAVEALADSLNRRFDEVIGRGAAVTAEDRAGLEIAIAGLKIVSTEVGLEVSSRVYEVAGASATKNSIGLDVYWRNIRTHSLHDPVDYKKIEVGANFLTGAVQPISLYT